MVLRCSDRISRVPPYLMRPFELPIRGCHPLWPDFPVCSCHSQGSADPRSLATTNGVSVDFLSSGYLDVSVPRVCSFNPIYSDQKYLFYLIVKHTPCPPLVGPPASRLVHRKAARSIITTRYQVGCPIRRSMDQSSFSAPHGLSQSITSFIASYCQGIHQTPFSRLI